MTDMTHTPGPWRVLHKTGVFPMDSDCWTIGTAEQHRKEHVANARLMAAAPDLLAALTAALVIIDDYLAYKHDGDPNEEDARLMGEMDINDYARDGRLAAARAAIARATGAAA